MIKNVLRNKLDYLRLLRNRRRMITIESSNMSNIELGVLSKLEWDEVCNKWQGVSQLKILPKYYQMFKSLERYDSDFVSDDIFMPFILRCLNDEKESVAYEHKGMYDVIFGDIIMRPPTIVNCINGTYYSAKRELVSKKEVIFLLKQENACIIKPSTGSCMGRNVRIIKATDNVDEILSSYGDNFIVQKIIKQSTKTATFNASSLNTFRITTLNINGVVSLCTILFRCGQIGSVVDNGAAGGLMVGVYEDGHFRDFAYNNKYQKYFEAPSGIRFSDGYIPTMPLIVEEIKNVHRICLPNMGFAGWDIALDENDSPIMIEVNLSWPGIQFEQLCPGQPIFGDRTSELISFVQTKKK